MERIFTGDIKFRDQGSEDLNAVRLSFILAMDVFEISKTFPKEKKYSLTDQIRRSSRSVCANLSEGYRKRVYPKSFSAKMIDSAGECSETLVHLKFATNCNYITSEILTYFEARYDEVGKILNYMYWNPEKFKPKS